MTTTTTTTSQHAEFHIAPMQCYTNSPTRHLFHLLSPSCVKWTEMEKINDLFPKSESEPEQYLFQALEKRLGPPQDYNEASHLVLQVGSNDPVRLQSCIEHATQRYSFREININCGCPSIESGGAATYGASLMKDASLTARLVESTRNALVTSSSSSSSSSTTKGGDAILVPDVSVKCRIGTFDHVDEMHPLNEADFDDLRKYVATIQSAGANHVILHARPAVLSGLSPVKNRIVPHVNHEFVERIAAEFPDMKVTLNGGIHHLSQLESLQNKGRRRRRLDDDDYSGTEAEGSRISSHMAGRWCLRRPLDLIGIEALLLQQNGENDTHMVAKKAIEKYTDYALGMASLPSNRQRCTMSELCLPLFLVVEQLRDDHDYEENEEDNSSNIRMNRDPVDADDRPMLSYDDIEDLYHVVRESVQQLESFSKRGKKKQFPTNSINFKHLSSSFKGLVGTKVANKWKRNRCEL
eukprot:scaffold37059_cov57-Attheya_sp.AAC.2